MTSIDLNLIASVSSSATAPASTSNPIPSRAAGTSDVVKPRDKGDRGFSALDSRLLDAGLGVGVAKLSTFSESSCSSLSGMEAEEEVRVIQPPSSSGSGRETPVKAALPPSVQLFLQSLPNLAYMLAPPGCDDAME